MTGCITSIAHLVLVAAPKGAGKTTFLANPRERLASFPEHPDLSFLAESPVKHYTLSREDRFPGGCLSRLVLHVDITRVLRGVAFQDLEQLRRHVEANPFHDWDLLRRYVQLAERVSILTIFVERSVNHRRWINRCLARLNQGRMMSSMEKIIRTAAILGYDGDNSAIHRALYRAWNDSALGMNLSSHHFLDVSAAKHHWMDYEQFL